MRAHRKQQNSEEGFCSKSWDRLQEKMLGTERNVSPEGGGGGWEMCTSKVHGVYQERIPWRTIPEERGKISANCTGSVRNEKQQGRFETPNWFPKRYWKRRSPRRYCFVIAGLDFRKGTARRCVVGTGVPGMLGLQTPFGSLPKQSLTRERAITLLRHSCKKCSFSPAHT